MADREMRRLNDSVLRRLMTRAVLAVVDAEPLNGGARNASAFSYRRRGEASALLELDSGQGRLRPTLTDDPLT